MSKPIDQERAIFENWYLSLPYGSPNFYDLRELADGSYKFASVRQLWDCWQARAAIQPAGVAVPEGWKLEDALKSFTAHRAQQGGGHDRE